LIQVSRISLNAKGIRPLETEVTQYLWWHIKEQFDKYGVYLTYTNYAENLLPFPKTGPRPISSGATNRLSKVTKK